MKSKTSEASGAKETEKVEITSHSGILMRHGRLVIFPDGRTIRTRDLPPGTTVTVRLGGQN